MLCAPWFPGNNNNKRSSRSSIFLLFFSCCLALCHQRPSYLGAGAFALSSPKNFWNSFVKRGWMTTTRLYAGVEEDEPVPFSSRQMAAVRALEAERPDRLFEDPLSHHFAGKDVMQQARERFNRSSTTSTSSKTSSQGVGRKIAVRTKFFDDFLLDCAGQSSSSSPAAAGPKRRFWGNIFSFFYPWRKSKAAAAAEGWGGKGQHMFEKLEDSRTPSCQQILMLGSGMDTRSWRLPLSHSRVIEVDVSAVLKAKEKVLIEVMKKEPGLKLTVKERKTVSADLSQRRWLEKLHGVLDPTQQVAVVMEGLLMYLEEEEVLRLLEQIGSRIAIQPGSWLGVSLVDIRSLRDAQASSSPLRQSWKWGCNEEDCGKFLSQALAGSNTTSSSSWQVRSVVRVGSPGGYPHGANYGCWKNVGKWKRKGKTLYVILERV